LNFCFFSFKRKEREKAQGRMASLPATALRPLLSAGKALPPLEYRLRQYRTVLRCLLQELLIKAKWLMVHS
jgi:hypothetical protein